MANELLYSGIGDARLTAVLAAEMDLALADRYSIRGLAHYAGDASRRGSTAIKVPVPSLNGADLMSAVAEGASVANTDVGLTSVTVTIARQALQRSISDLAELTDSVGYGGQALVSDLVVAADMRWTQMACEICDDFTSTVGTTTVDADMDDWFSAQFTLTQASVPNDRIISTLYPTQWTDLQNSLRGEAGAIQYKSDAQSALGIAGQGFAGMLNGVAVLLSTHVPTANAGADSAGCMRAIDAITYADGLPQPIMGAGGVVYPAGTRMFVEMERDASGALTKFVGNLYLGLSILQDSKGVSIITDR